MSYKNFSVNKPLVTLQIANTVRKDSCQFFLGKKQGANSSKEKERFPHVIVRLSSKLWYESEKKERMHVLARCKLWYESEKKERMHVLARYEYDAEWNPMTPLQFVLVGTPGPYSSSSLRTTILCPRLPSSPPPPAGRCPLDPRSCDTTTTTFDSFLQNSKGEGDSCCINCLCYKCFYLRYLPSTYAFSNFI